MSLSELSLHTIDPESTISSTGMTTLMEPPSVILWVSVKVRVYVTPVAPMAVLSLVALTLVIAPEVVVYVIPEVA